MVNENDRILEAINELNKKIDTIAIQQNQILAYLSSSDVSSPAITTKHLKETKIEGLKAQIKNDFMLYFLNRHRLRREFNLLQTPQSHRVFAYLKTGDIKAFDGLKRIAD